MRINRVGYPAIVIIFKKRNGEMWEEHYSSYAIDILKRDMDVYEIRYVDTDELIYRRGF